MSEQRIAVVAVAVLAGLASFGAVRWWTRAQPAELVAVQDVPDDVRRELSSTWDRFEQAFPARQTCIDDVNVLLVRDVDGGDARYVGETATIEIRIPTTPPRFRESLAHELAHHIDATCEEFDELRAELRTVFGGGPWSTGPTWYEVPAEMWAEHVAELVTGDRVRHADEVPADPDVMRSIAAWGDGG